MARTLPRLSPAAELVVRGVAAVDDGEVSLETKMVRLRHTSKMCLPT